MRLLDQPEKLGASDVKTVLRIQTQVYKAPRVGELCSRKSPAIGPLLAAELAATPYRYLRKVFLSDRGGYFPNSEIIIGFCRAADSARWPAKY